MTQLKVYVMFGGTGQKAPVWQFENAKIKLNYKKNGGKYLTFFLNLIIMIRIFWVGGKYLTKKRHFLLFEGDSYTPN